MDSGKQERQVGRYDADDIDGLHQTDREGPSGSRVVDDVRLGELLGE